MRKLTIYILSVFFGVVVHLSPSYVQALPTNLIPNPSFEAASPTNTQLPQDWKTGRWGTNTSSLSYLNNGRTGGKSVGVQVTSYTSGDAKWFFEPVNVTAGATYTFSDYYISTVNSEVLAAFIDVSGKYSYKFLSAPASSPLTWKQVSKSFTVPSGTVKMTVYHMLYSVGNLQVDDYSLTQTSATQISLDGLTEGQTLSSDVELRSNANDPTGISNVRYKLDGQYISPSLTTSPYAFNWDTTTTTNGAHVLEAEATNNIGQSTLSNSKTINVANAVNPTDNLLKNGDFETADPNNTSRPLGWRGGKWGSLSFSHSYQQSGRNGGHSVRTEINQYTSGAAYWYNLDLAVTPGSTYLFSDYFQSNVNSEIDVGVKMSDGSTRYIYLGTLAASPNDWVKFEKQFTVPAGAISIVVYHEIYSVGWLNVDDYKLTSYQPKVSLTQPINGQSINGIKSLQAEVTDTVSTASVQFRVDGQNVGSPDTTAPYSYNLDTTSLSNGTHKLSAISTNISGQTFNSSEVSVNVNNQPPYSNLIQNPGMELSSPSNPNKPTNWLSTSWGSNSTSFSYVNGGRQSDRAIKAEISQYISGSAHWYTPPININSGQMYDYSDYYMSNVTTQILAAYRMSDGTTRYVWLGSPVKSPTSWTKFRKQIIPPAGAVSVQIYHELTTTGWVVSDDYRFAPSSYEGFSNPIISITVDDGFSNLYTNGIPILDKYGYKSTNYITTGSIDRTSGYLTSNMIISMHQNGHEIGSHTVSHPDLSNIGEAALIAELRDSQLFLQNVIGSPVLAFASPYGNYNQHIIDVASQYYQSFRSVGSGYNDSNNLDRYQILVQNLHSDTSLAEFQSWIDQAKATNTWLVLVYHQFDTNNNAGLYNTRPEDLDAQLNLINASGIPVKTVSQALAEIMSQL